jgi:hypothetical protein
MQVEAEVAVTIILQVAAEPVVVAMEQMAALLQDLVLQIQAVVAVVIVEVALLVQVAQVS